VSLRRDHFIPVDKAVNKKEQLEKGLEAEERKKHLCNSMGDFHNYVYMYEKVFATHPQ
jgi:hypothetical protein